MSARTSRDGSIGLVTIRSPLSRDEEEHLQQLITRGRQAAQELNEGIGHSTSERTALRRAVRRGRKAEEDLLSGTCALVKKRVTDLGFSFDQDELEAAGLEGLVTALRAFDPDHGVRFATYANYWISKMVYSSISHRVPYPESDLRLVIKLRRLQRHHEARALTVADVMKALEISRPEAARVMKMSDDIAAGMADVEHEDQSARVLDSSEPWPEAEWVIEQLKEILGSEFTDFWMWTGRVMSLDELGRRNGISKQAMAKRVQRWRRLVETSEHADEMLSWLKAQ